MKFKRNLMLLLTLTALASILASCSVCERSSLITPPQTTKFSQSSGSNFPPVTTTASLNFKGDNEMLTIQFREDGVCQKALLTLDGKVREVACEKVRREFKEFKICIKEEFAEEVGHDANATLHLKSDSGKESPNYYCADLNFISNGADFRFEPNEGKNIRCGAAGGSAYCPQ